MAKLRENCSGKNLSFGFDNLMRNKLNRRCDIYIELPLLSLCNIYDFIFHEGITAFSVRMKEVAQIVLKFYSNF